jgi:hypothetical protein
LSTWANTIKAYEASWARQDAERRAAKGRHQETPRGYAGPACFPAPEYAFASYPGTMLEAAAELQAADGAAARVAGLLRHPLTSYAAARRSGSAALIAEVLAAARGPARVADLDAVFAGHGVAPQVARGTVAWMLKYNLLRVVKG